jgi:predicted MFS family arabinose efflux permease
VTTTGARRATSIIFLICGTAISSWAPLVPFAKTNLAVDDAALGLILLALGGGSMVAMPLAGVAIHYWGSRPVIVTSVILACLALPLLAVHIAPAMLAGTLFVFGAALGAMDVAMNAQAIAVQHAAARPIMSGFHAFFSVGGLLGAAIMTLLLRAGLSPIASAAGLAVALLALGLSQHARFLPDRGASAVSTTFRIAPSPRVLVLGALCFIAFLAEGAVLDWSAVFLRELRQVDISIAGVGYAVFSVTMIAGRLTGDRLTDRLGAARILWLGGLLCSAGFLSVAWVPHTAAALAGFAAIGLGASNIVPVLFSATGRVPGVAPGIALATVTTIAYAGLLVGPALIGLVADLTSLPAAFVLVAVLLSSFAVSARALPHPPVTFSPFGTLSSRK